MKMSDDYTVCSVSRYLAKSSKTLCLREEYITLCKYRTEQRVHEFIRCDACKKNVSNNTINCTYYLLLTKYFTSIPDQVVQIQLLFLIQVQDIHRVLVCLFP